MIMVKSVFQYLHQEVITEVKRFKGGGAYAPVPTSWIGKNCVVKMNLKDKYDISQKFLVKRKNNGGAFIAISVSQVDKQIFVKLLEDTRG